MCLAPIKVFNRAKYVNIHGGARAYFIVPCGKCAECRNTRINEYIARSQSEFEHTHDLGGYTYFESLTYHDKFIPSWNGINVFSSRDITLFFKNVHSKLRRLGYYDLVGSEKKVNLKYFITCEYGSETHRPHYHLLFYVLCRHFLTHKLISAAEFYNVLKDSWQDKGILDIYKKDKQTGKCVRYKSPYEKVLKSDDKCKVISYVCKYLTKEDEFVQLLENKVKLLMLDSHVDKELLKPSAISEYLPFHRQSQGYGLSLCNLDSVSKQLLYTQGMIRIPDTRKVWRKIPVPQYIMRKLFMEQVKLRDGSLSWHYTEKGKLWKLGLLHYKIRKLSENISNLVNNADSYCPDGSLRSMFFQSLQGRGLSFLAEYILYYRGRLLSPSSPLLSPYDLLSQDYKYELNGASLDFMSRSLGFTSVEKFIDCELKDFKVDSVNFYDIFSGFDECINTLDCINYYRYKKKEIYYADLAEARKRAKKISPYLQEKERRSRLYSRMILNQLEKNVKKSSLSCYSS